MPRILVINPNSSSACGAGIDAAVAPFRTPGGPAIDVLSVPDGPPAILSWRDWHAAVEPMCRLAEREAADAIVIACASDPGLEAMRAALGCPVLGVFRCAAAAAARAEWFGVVAIVDASMVVLGCTGMAGHRAAVEQAAGVPVIEPCQAGVAMARLALLG